MQLWPPFSRILPGEPANDFPLISLVIVNLVTIILAIVGNWDLATVMFSYWVQSVMIGIFTALSLLTAGSARKFPAPPAGDSAAATFATLDPAGSILARFGMTIFFVIHYGIFHFAYYEFIVDSGIFGPVNFSEPGLYLSCGLFFVNHLYSFAAHWNVHIHEAGGDDFFAPYHRIIPMHLTIIFGSIVIFILQEMGITSTMPVLVLFLVLKTWADIAAHLAKHTIVPPDQAAGAPE
ncbi:MAG: hypothetical protein GYA23_08280 [Methanomicrobiales archaeon]|nr:hypothetical protein [Methanomicrobiales archaeon]